MAVAPDTRARIVRVTAELFRRHGYAGTGLKQVVAAADAPFGSLYHHFPGGKEELGDQVIRTAGAMYLELFEAIADDAPSIVSGVERFFAGAGETLRQTDFADACPIETVALEVASTNETLRLACADTFASWADALAARLVLGGVDELRANQLALVVLSLLEGAFVLARTFRTTEPLDAAGATATEVVQAALATAGSGHTS